MTTIKFVDFIHNSETKYHLMRNNYYSVINFYNKPFIIERINTEDIYITGVHFNEIGKIFEKRSYFKDYFKITKL